MALYHFHVSQVSRGAGQSAVASAAYRAGQKLRDNYYGETHDYTKKGGVIMSEILLPDNAPERFLDRETLWNEVENVEKNAKAQLAYSFDFALQNELSREENIRIAREFVTECFVGKGMICDMAIHEPGKDPGDIPNPHVHVLVPMRPLNEDGTWGNKQHREYVLDEKGNRIRDSQGKYIFNAVKNTDWGDPETLNYWRAMWAKKVNESFEQNGIAARIDHRSYIDQGLDILPQIHEGPTVRAMEAKGITTEKGDWNRFVKAINRAVTRILGIFKSVIDDIDEMKKAKADAKAKNADFWEAIEEYRQALQGTYNYGRSRVVSKKMIDLYSFISCNDIWDLESLKDYSQVMYKEVAVIRAEVKKWEEKANACDRELKLVETMKRWSGVYNQWYRISDTNKKKAFYSEHEPQMNAYHMAKRELKKKYPDLKIPVNEIKRKREEYKDKALAAGSDLDHYKKAASQAYAIKKQVYDAHKERKQIKERNR